MAERTSLKMRISRMIRSKKWASIFQELSNLLDRANRANSEESYLTYNEDTIDIENDLCHLVYKKEDEIEKEKVKIQKRRQKLKAMGFKLNKIK